MKQTLSILVIAILISTAVTAFPVSFFSGKIHDFENLDTRKLSIVPSIKTGMVKIIFKADKAATGTLLVMDQSGSTVIKQFAAIQAGSNTILLKNFINLKEGAYSVYVKAGKTIFKSSYLLWK